MQHKPMSLSRFACQGGPSHKVVPAQKIKIFKQLIFNKNMNILQMLILCPYIALIPTFVFGVIYFKFHNKIIGLTTVLWLLYFIYETLNLLRITCSGDCNIRVDLLLIYPILLIFSLISIVKVTKILIKR